MAMLGKLIGNYQITAELAQGRLGPVYRGQTVDQTREVVIKTIHLAPFPASTQIQLKARFRREMFVQRQLQHPNIARVYDFLHVEDKHYVVMEFVPGSSLRELLVRQGLPSVAQAVYLVKQALAALDYAHSFHYLDQSDFQRTGLMHGDLKPSNLLLDQNGRLRLTDFGIVNKVLNGEGRKAAAEFYEQQSDYLAPEQLRGVTSDAGSDIYSLGVTFYEMLTGRLPFTDWPQSGTLDLRHLTGEAEAQSLTEIRPDVPPSLALVVARAIRRNPKERHASASEFLRAILNCEPQISTSELTTRIHALKQATQSSPLPAPQPALTAKQTPAPPPPVAPPPLPQTSAPLPRAQTKVQTLPPGPMVLNPATRVEPIKRNTAAFATQQPLALPRSVPINVAPPQFTGFHKARREWWLLPFALASVFIGALAGAYFFSSPSNNAGLASNVTPRQAVASPTPAATVMTSLLGTDELAQRTAATPRSLLGLPATKSAFAAHGSPLLELARVAEQQERYHEAVKAYEDFVTENPAAPFAAVAKARAINLRFFLGLLTNGHDALTDARYGEARQKFAEALKLRPASKSAQSGLQEAAAKLPDTLPDAVMAPATSTREGNHAPDAEKNNETGKEIKSEQRETLGGKPEPAPGKQPRAEESSPRPRTTTPKPTPTPDTPR